MNKFLTISLLTILGPLLYSQNQALFQYIVFIEAQDIQLAIEETGAGLLVGYDDQRMYVSTAHHVVAGMTDIKIRFRGDGNVFPARLMSYDRELDLAILSIAATPAEDALSPIILKMEEEFRRGEPVFSVGHPFGEGWQWNERNSLLDVSYGQDRELATITPQAIVPGCSGGPVFDLKEELIGLVLRENQVNATLVRAYTLKQKLRDWRIPSNLILSNEEWWAGLTPTWQSTFREMVRTPGRKKTGAADNVPASSFFTELFAATKFDCNDCGFTDLSPLARMGKLQEVIARANAISDLSPLTKLSQLRHLDLRDNQLRSLQPLARSYNLETLDVSENRALDDLSPLSDLLRLRDLNFTRTDIRTIQPLMQLNDLRDLRIFLTDVPASERRQFKRQLPKARLRYRNKREGLAQLIYQLTHPAGKKKMEPVTEPRDEPTPGVPAWIRPTYPSETFPIADSPVAVGNRPASVSNEPVLRPAPSQAPVTTAELPSPNETFDPPPVREVVVPKPAPPQANTPVRLESKVEATSAPPQATPAVSAQREPAPVASPPVQPQLGKVPSPGADPGAITVDVDSEKEERLRTLLVERRFAEAEQQADSDLGKDPGNNLYRVYLILGRLYQGNYNQAHDLWFIFQNRSLNNGENFTNKLLAEIRALESRGITSGVVKKFSGQLRSR